MASSLVLPPADSLSGQWTVTDKSNSCIIQLSTESVESANGYRLSISPSCGYVGLPEATVAWRPMPDGIALLDCDGSTVLFFSREGEHYRSQIWDNSGKVLKRSKK
ncbi:AprI/Inh family metalloprotease inhibitor [Escherichia coli]|uniref:AprI/Inh family metalloprotease inhibitor n=1 Tax=Escherichia coli TaxID=562 RepID=UPI000BE96519|nr:AprI/Inh family metalloprotease inhibitor [Escherichia coli]EFO1665478.1 protease [Escherichia coli]MBB2457727.1 AprI/Inh family metalloprotease inhibitor [Escherichia coli]MBB7059871.1 AprI/Inh family metalloprotease inhibitor [Escherichia coli]